MPGSLQHAQLGGLDSITLVAPDGSRVTVLQQGAQLVSWQVPGVGEQLYLSPNSALTPGTPVRGGVPVVFPQFDTSGPLDKHGFARTRIWKLVNVEPLTECITASLLLTDNDLTWALWPQHFSLLLRVKVSAKVLELELTCTNTGDTAFDFTCALHSYLRVRQLAHCQLHGLQNASYYDKVRRVESIQRNEFLTPQGETDRIYRSISNTLSLHEQDASARRTMQIQLHEFDDVVVWNPGPQKCVSLSDMPMNGYQQMLCVEAAVIGRPIRLAPSQRWTGSQQFILRSA